MSAFLTMSGVVADIMDALGKPEAAANLRHFETGPAYEDLALELEAAEEKAGALEEQVDDLATDLGEVHREVIEVRKLVDRIGELVEAVLGETPHEECNGKCSRVRLVAAVDEARRAIKSAEGTAAR